MDDDNDEKEPKGMFGLTSEEWKEAKRIFTTPTKLMEYIKFVGLKCGIALMIGLQLNHGVLLEGLRGFGRLFVSLFG